MRDAGQNGVNEPRPATVAPWHERHPGWWAASKRAAALLTVGLIAFVGALSFQLRDGVRDNTAAVETSTAEQAVIRDHVGAVDKSGLARDTAIRKRMREVEGHAVRSTEALGWIIRSLERLERAAGTYRHAPPAPVMGPPEPHP
jgi:hypothetical protein